MPEQKGSQEVDLGREVKRGGKFCTGYIDLRQVTVSSSTENGFLKISNKTPLEKRGKRFFTVSRFFLLHFECPIFAQPLIFLVQRMTDFKKVRQYHRRT